jgi:hypothetical protein
MKSVKDSLPVLVGGLSKPPLTQDGPRMDTRTIGTAAGQSHRPEETQTRPARRRAGIEPLWRQVTSLITSSEGWALASQVDKNTAGDS